MKGRAGGGEQWRPYVTVMLVLGLVAWQVYVTQGQGHADAPTLVQYGARKANLGFPQAPWRLIASVFLHANWWHLISNVILLAAWGACLEKILGRLEMLVSFMLAGLWGSLASDLYGPSALALGASGAVFAMLSAVLILSMLARDWPQWEGQSSRWLRVSMAAVALNALSAVGFASIVQGARLDHWAHAGGALCGVTLALAPALAGVKNARGAFWGAALVLLATAAAMVFSRGSSPFALHELLTPCS